MNIAEKHQALQGNKVTGQVFRGIFSSDNAPAVLNSLPGACIVNTDPSDQLGMHWVALYQETSGVTETFESFGKDLSSCSDNFLELTNSKRTVKQSY